MAKGHTTSIVDNKTNYGIIPQAEVNYLMTERAKKIKDHPCYGTDICNADPIDYVVRINKPDVIVHMASFPRQKVVNANPAHGADVMMRGLINMLESAKADTPKVQELMAFWGIGNALHKGGMVSPGLWLRRESLAVLARNQLGVIHTDLAACNAYKDALARAAAVKCPTVLVLGDGDLMTPLSKGKALGQAIAGARTVVLKDSGHFMMVERPDETLDALKSHV